MRIAPAVALGPLVLLLPLAACSGAKEPADAPGLQLTAVESLPGEVPLGTERSAVFKVTNARTEAMTHAPLVLLERRDEASRLWTTCTDPLPPQGSCTIEVTFAPTSPGKLAATLVVLDDGADVTVVDAAMRIGAPSRAARPQDPVVPLSTIAIRAAGVVSREGRLVWSDYSLAGATKTLRLWNGGAVPAPATLTALGNDAAAFVLGTCPPVFAPGEECTMTVTVEPQQPGDRRGTLSWEGGSVPLEARGIDAAEIPDARRVASPTRAAIRALESHRRGDILLDAEGSVFRWIDRAKWERVPTPRGVVLTHVATYSDRDGTYDGLAGVTADGVVYTSRDGAPFGETVKASPPAAIIGMRVVPTGRRADTGEWRWVPSSILALSNGQTLTSEDFAPFVLDAHPPLAVGEITKLAECSLGRRNARAVVTAAGLAFFVWSGADEGARAVPGSGFVSVSCEGDKVVFVGANGLIVASSDGATWNTAPPPTAATLHAVRVSGHLMEVAGSDGALFTSFGGSPWEARRNTAATTLRIIGGQLVGGDDGVLLRLP